MMILGLGLSLRLWGIRFGLPFLYHYDEHFYVNTVLKLGTGVLNYPPYAATGFSNILFVEYAAYFILGWLSGAFVNATQFEAAFRSDPTVFYLLARLTTAFLGTITVLVVYWLGARSTQRTTGLVAAIFLSVNLLHVRDSHYAVPDVATSFFILLAVTLAYIGLQQHRRSYLYGAALVGGLAMAIKWTGAVALVPIILASIFEAGKTRPWLVAVFGRQTMLCILLFALGFGLASPQILISPAPYVQEAIGQYNAGQTGGFEIWQVDTVSGWYFYLKTLWYGLGTVLLALSLIGLAMRVARIVMHRDQASVVLVTFPLFYFIAMGATRHYFARYALPLAPFAAIFAAETIVAFGAWLGARSSRMGRPLVMGLVLIALIQPLTASIRHGMLLTRTDTRTQAKAWIEQNIPAGAKIAVDWPTHGPPLSTAERPAPNSTRTYAISLVGGTGLAERSIDWYREQGYQYLIASSFIYQIPLVSSEQDQERKAFYASLEREFTEVQTFHPTRDGSEPDFIFDEIYGPAISLWQRERPGPTIRIYQVSDLAPLGRNEQ
jgi:hypothetical protein